MWQFTDPVCRTEAPAESRTLTSWTHGPRPQMAEKYRPWAISNIVKHPLRTYRFCGLLLLALSACQQNGPSIEDAASGRDGIQTDSATAVVHSVEVVARAEGVPPADMLTRVTIPLEDACRSIKDIARIRSVTRANECIVRLDADSSAAVGTLRNAVEQAVREHRDAQDAPGYPTEFRVLPERDATFIIVYLESSEFSAAETAKLLSHFVQSRLTELPSIAGVESAGIGIERIAIVCDPDQCERFGVSVAGLHARLTEEDAASIRTIAGLEQLSIGGTPGRDVQLRDLASVRQAVAPNRTTFTSQAGTEAHPSAFLAVYPRPGQVPSVVRSLQDLALELGDAVPQRVQIKPLSFASTDIEATLQMPAGTPRETLSRMLEVVVNATSPLAGDHASCVYTADDAGEIRVLLSVPESDRGQQAQQLREILAQIPGVGVRVDAPQRIRHRWPADRRDISIVVLAQDAEAMITSAAQLVDQLQNLAEVVDISQDAEFVNELRIDADRCRELGVAESEAQLVLTALDRGIPVAGLSIEELPVVLRLSDDAVESRSAVLRHSETVRIPDAQGGRVFLQEVLTEDRMLTAVYRDGERTGVLVTCQVVGGDPTAVRLKIQAIAESLSTNDVVIEVE